MNDLIREIENADSIAITGHINPDGDCIGSTLGMYNYITNNYPGKKVQVYLQEFPDVFMFLNGASEVKHETDDEIYDLFMSLDCGDPDRFTPFAQYFETAKRTLCIDHHISNKGFGDVCYVEPQACSAAEAIFKLLDEDKINQPCAEALYMGIVHDTGVFKHSNTTRSAMTIAGILIEKGARPSFVIDETFYKKTLTQNKLLGYALLGMKQFANGKIAHTLLTFEDFEKFGASKMDTDGIVDQLRLTSGTEVAFFMYQSGENEYKISLRANNIVNVSEIACSHGGGGHVKAAGCNIKGDPDKIVAEIVAEIEKQFKVSWIGINNNYDRRFYQYI